ncbi:riboflavin kinase [Claviceps maximensis]|nr:riboflavin kinase [Claviceps maximensis]
MSSSDPEAEAIGPEAEAIGPEAEAPEAEAPEAEAPEDEAPEDEAPEDEALEAEAIGPDSGPISPYPCTMEGEVIRGYGRGSADLGVPTANLPVDSSRAPWISATKSGVYFGYAALSLPEDHPEKADNRYPDSPFALFPMVMSIGFNPFYRNKMRSAEVHILHEFSEDFYGAYVRLLILGFIREEKNYDTEAELVGDIRMDCAVTRASLERENWKVEAIKLDGNGKGKGEGETNGLKWLLRDM